MKAHRTEGVVGDRLTGRVRAAYQDPDIEGPPLPPAHPVGHEEMQAPPLRALHDKVTESADVLRAHDVAVTIDASFP